MICLLLLFVLFSLLLLVVAFYPHLFGMIVVCFFLRF